MVAVVAVYHHTRVRLEGLLQEVHEVLVNDTHLINEWSVGLWKLQAHKLLLVLVGFHEHFGLIDVFSAHFDSEVGVLEKAERPVEQIAEPVVGATPEVGGIEVSIPEHAPLPQGLATVCAGIAD